MKIKMTEEDFVAFIQKDAVKTSNKDQAKQLVSIMKKYRIGFNYAVIWDDVKQGSIFSFSEKSMLISRDPKQFGEKNIINFKDIIWVEGSSNV